MSTVEFITYEELLRECNIKDSATLQRALRNRKGVPQVSPRKLVPRKAAEIIVEMLTGQRIDWWKYKSKQRDEKDDGPLTWSTSQEILRTADNWFTSIERDSIAESGTHFVALACSGGFLSGPDSSPFVVGFDKGINIIIGDRGSGKSTVLSLLGALSDSVGEETQVLIKRLLSILQPEKDIRESERASLNRRILRMLRFYGISEYGIFFTTNGGLHCYYINRDEQSYSFLRYVDNSWEFDPDGNAYLQIPLLSLSQGEVIRIAEDQGQSFYLSNLLDAIYPDLFEERTRLFQSAQSILRQQQLYKPSFYRLNTARIANFVGARFAELKRIQQELNNGSFSIVSETIIRDYLQRSQFFSDQHPELPWDRTRILDLFEHEDQNVLHYLYVNRIKKFLFEQLAEISILRNQSDAFGDYPTNILDLETMKFREATDGNEIQNVEDLDIELLFEERLEDIPHVLDEYRDEPVERNAIQGEQAELETSFKSIDAEERAGKRRELLDIASRVVDFLTIRLRILANWNRVYSRQREKYEDSLKSLANSYASLLDQKIHLVRTQSQKCRTITNTLNKEDLAINVFTVRAEEMARKLQDLAQKIRMLDKHYQVIQQATPSTEWAELKESHFEYDNTISTLNREIALLEDQISENNIDYFTFPIKIELLQGNTFRDFQQLSFGQKSGIILKMVLSTTTRSIIAIDQPEDNLDAYSIINIIAPALKSLQTQHNRQIIVVTHNSNLVMEAEPDRLIALESLGDRGRIKYLGAPVGKQAVKEIFDILEGGVQTFEQKIKTYENFVGMAKKIENWDIQLIESSFRQRTIDGLRNYLQPIIADSSMLDFLRHQLKQWNPKDFQLHLREFINQLEQMERAPETSHDELLLMLTKLADELHYHLQQFMTSINEIRMMDTQPKSDIVDLYAFLQKKEHDPHIARLRQSRQIKIEISPAIKGIGVIADSNHLELVFKNLFENSLRATEKVAIRNRSNGYAEMISITLEGQNDKHVRLLYSDNGCGISQEIMKRLYLEPCSTKEGKEGHGLGAIIIRKLLEINNGSIDVIENRVLPPNTGLTQRIILTKAPTAEPEI